MPSACSADGLAILGRTASAMAKTATTRSVLDEVDRRLARAAEAVGGLRSSSGLGAERLASSAGPPTRSVRPSTSASTPGRRWRGSPPPGHVEAALLGAEQDGRAIGCSESRSTAAASRSASSSDDAVGNVATVDHAVLAEGQRAGLVEDDGIEVARLLEPAPVAHEQAVLRAQRRRDRDHERDGEAEACGQAMTSTVTTR
jgi:hypothetical protein